MSAFWLCFVPLFVAVDPFGVLPMFLSLTSGVDARRRRLVILESVGTALVVALGFLFGGKALLGALGITLDDFMVAGGVLLLVLSVSDLITFEKSQRRVDPEGLGAVPLGVPLIVGPAVLTTIMLLVGEHGVLPTVGATVGNVLIAGVVFWWAEAVTRVLGDAGTRILSKIANLFLAAIAVMLVRKGITGFVVGH